MRAHIMRMPLYLREIVFVYMHKCKRSFLRAYARVCVCVFARINAKTLLHTKYFNTQTHFGFRNFQDVLQVVLINDFFNLEWQSFNTHKTVSMKAI